MGRKRRPNYVMSFLTLLIALGTLSVSLFPVLNLKEGSFFYALLSHAHKILNSYANATVFENYRVYGLIPINLLCLLNFILAICGSGPLAFIFRCTLYASLYLIGIYVQGPDPLFEILNVLPSDYHYIGLGAFLVSLMMLSIISKVKNRNKDVEKKNKKDKIKKEKKSDKNDFSITSNTDEAEVKTVNVTNYDDIGLQVKQEETTETKEDDVVLSKRAVSTLVDVEVPSFESFQDYHMNSSVSSVDRTVYSVTEREAQIKKEEQEKRRILEENKRKEEERMRLKQEEENRLIEERKEQERLANMFKPRNLMKRLSEDEKVEKSFPSFSSSDYSTNESQIQINENPNKVQFTALENDNKQESVAVRFARADFEVANFNIPVSQMQNPFEEAAKEPEVEVKAPFKEASAQAEIEQELAQMRREAEAAKRQLEELKERERQRREAAEESNRIKLELERAKAELALRRQAETQIEQETEEINIMKKEEIKQTTEEMEVRKDNKKEPDIDLVSGVAGTKNANSGSSYLLDKQRYTYEFPPQSLLKHYQTSSKIYEDVENDPNGKIIVDTFKQFRIDTTLVGIQHGPTFTLYELTLQKGVKVGAVLNLSENLAMDLSVEAVRILAPIPGKPAIGVEVPNKNRETIGFDIMMRELLAKDRKIPMVLGKNITGDSIVIDIAKTPHLLVAGTTGSGKSVCINGLICSVLFTKTPKEVRMILVDPKMVELSLYNGIPHLLTPVITDSKKALKAMAFVVEEMERRMALFSALGAKSIQEYNEMIEKQSIARVKLPYIMVIIDEFADLMLSVGKELETSIKRITAVARFCGIHLVLATQRPSSDVITGIIKSNMPTQIAFAVSNSMNSRIIIDTNGAEKLLGRGDMLYNCPESRNPSRIQGAFIDSEIAEIVRFVKTQGEPDYIDESYFEDDDEDEDQSSEESTSSASEDMFTRAWKIVSDRGEASASYIQRRLGVGYNRAANLIEQLEDAGYIGPPRGSKPREILKMYGCD